MLFSLVFNVPAIIFIHEWGLFDYLKRGKKILQITDLYDRYTKGATQSLLFTLPNIIFKSGKLSKSEMLPLFSPKPNNNCLASNKNRMTEFCLLLVFIFPDYIRKHRGKQYSQSILGGDAR